MIGERNSMGDDAACLHCGRVLAHFLPLNRSQFCGDACRFRHSTLPPHEVCSSCGRKLTPQQFGERLCDDILCRRESEKRARDKERLRIEGLRQEAQELRDRSAGLLAIAEPEEYPVAIIPARRWPLVPLDESRLRSFRATLSGLIKEAVARLGRHASEPATRPFVQPFPELKAVAGRACGLCRGWCCQTGGNHAYLTVDTIHRYMIAHPEQGPEEVLATYLLHLGEETIEHSCIFHQAGGCGMPQELRSNTCNRFYCKGLVEYLEVVAERGSPRGFIAATEDVDIVAAAFCDEDGAMLVGGTADAYSDLQLDDR